MTLIITAICKDGVFIKSDKRRKLPNSDKYEDNLKKVFVSQDKRIIIYNHGINEINGKWWRDLAFKSAKQIQHDKVSDINKALDEVEKNVFTDAIIELSKYPDTHLCAFVVILKVSSNEWSAGEIYWKKGQGVTRNLNLDRFILSGAHDYVCYSSKYEQESYFASISMTEAKAEIDLLWADAVRNQDRAHGQEFSSTCDEVGIT
jgi:hypothetical protein